MGIQLVLRALFVCSASVSAFHIHLSPVQPTVPASACHAPHRGLHATSSEPPVPSISYIPSRIELDDATVSYPETLMSKLFSSVPKRQYAIDHIKTSFGSDGIETSLPTVLVGRSASGKSTLLRLISGGDVPTSGTVAIGGLAKPIIIDRKPPLDDSRSVLDGIVTSALQKKKAGQTDISKHYGLLQRVAVDFATTLGLTLEQQQSKPSSLSPSGLFLFGLACGCLCSVMPAFDAQLSKVDSSYYSLPGPILLLDELFDFEHTDVPAKCCPGIDSLLQDMGAVVIIATHKPHHWEALQMRRGVALSSGRILSEEVLKKGESMKMVYK